MNGSEPGRGARGRRAIGRTWPSRRLAVVAAGLAATLGGAGPVAALPVAHPVAHPVALVQADPAAAAARPVGAVQAAVFEGSPEVLKVPVAPEPGAGGASVTLDVAVYATPNGGRRPAVVLAHGFGGSRADLDGAARELAGHGYVAVAYTARGFGASGGRIHLMDPQIEGQDIRRIVDLLATRPDVQLDAPGDPRVGMAGGSYGGAATLIAGGLDPRLDALAAAITWNDLANAFFPDYAAPNLATDALAPGGGAGSDPAAPGPFKRRWASHFFVSALAAAPPSQAGPTATCGRFEATICGLFLAAAQSGKPSERLVAELHRRSPAVTNARIVAPTLLLQGMNDSLFPLDQAGANARQIAAAGAPVAVRWLEGGHDGGAATGAEDAANTGATQPYLAWFDTYLRGDGTAEQRRARPMPEPGFVYSAPAYARGAPDRRVSFPAYPGLPSRAAGPGDGTAPVTPSMLTVPFTNRDQRAMLISPPGGDPAGTSNVPGSDGAADAIGGVAYRLAALPGQSVAFDTAPVPRAVTVVGSPRVRLTVISTTTDATLFVSWWKVAAGAASSPRRQVSPVRVVTQPGVPSTVEVALPAGTYALDQGTTWRVLVSATDAAYSTPTDARVYSVALAGDAVTLPTLPTAAEPVAPRDSETSGLLVALVAVLATLGVAAAIGITGRRRGDATHARPDLADVPLAVSNLVKTYADGHRAVDDVTWQAGRGQVVGLLGPNGAGKTTTIRMILGLIQPDSGDIHVHGQPVHAGSPALAGLGALVEGPGFLPHLSGRANLEAYWAATGRPREEAQFEEALDVAALGDALERPVKSYSHGMRQRLGIAQAMLGMPEVLLLDEPTNGLDPPQIAAMRPILRRYAETGRTVVVSSHLLAEVEMTCSHVVVMHRGRVVLAGAVPDLVESADTTVVDLAGDLASAQELAQRLRLALPGVQSVTAEVADGTTRLVVHAAASRAQVARAVLDAGGEFVAVSGRRHLEEVFLGVIAADDLESARKVRPR
ncbi:MAG: alpha/beta fold hydrolase [Actinobacteria bacterium]|nr:alpha/beta fold hydrolase [Actinomycetota bacterium]